MKKISILLIAILINSCSFNEVLTENNNFKFKLRNYTSSSYSNAKLYIGAKGIRGNFIALDSIIYLSIPDNISPSDEYNIIGEYSNVGKSSDGFYYFDTRNEKYLDITFPISSMGTTNIDENQVLAISEKIGFLFRLTNQQEIYIEGFSLIDGIINPRPDKIVNVGIYIKDIGISWEVTSNLI